MSGGAASGDGENVSIGRLILVRHGESEGNSSRRFSVTNEIDLTPLGVEQARAAGRRIGELYRASAIVASPFRRAQRTAALIAEEIAHRETIAIEPDLRERSIGDLAGEPYASMAKHPTYDRDRFWEWQPPGGESLVDVQRRAAQVLTRLARAHPGRDVVVVSHGGTMLALCAHVEGGWLRPRVPTNCDLVVVTHGPSGALQVVSVDSEGPRTPEDPERSDATG